MENSSTLVSSKVMALFVQIIQGEPVVNTPGHLDIGFNSDNLFIFTLPGLHALLNDQVKTDYLSFRNSIYQSSLNADLSVFGHTIKIEKPSSHIDHTWYKLCSIDQNPISS